MVFADNLLLPSTGMQGLSYVEKLQNQDIHEHFKWLIVSKKRKYMLCVYSIHRFFSMTCLFGISNNTDTDDLTTKGTSASTTIVLYRFSRWTKALTTEVLMSWPLRMTWRLYVLWVICEKNPPVTGRFRSPKANNAVTVMQWYGNTNNQGFAKIMAELSKTNTCILGTAYKGLKYNANHLSHWSLSSLN